MEAVLHHKWIIFVEKSWEVCPKIDLVMTLDGTQAQVYGPSPEFLVGIPVSSQISVVV
jgi:hypothetical protein